jgi:predicted nucleotidyltransferase
MKYEDILKRVGLNDNDVINAYQYGSRVYGNYNKKSDFDFIFVVKKVINEQFSDNQININFFTLNDHVNRVKEHEISALETLFLSKEYILKESQVFDFKLDKSKLRHSLSAKSSNSWVKAKKKLTIPQDYDLNIGRKSLFHSFRIIDFGIQIANNGVINDYSSCNELYNEIMSYYEWSELFNTFKLRYNQLISDFRKVAEK